jgi:hypothetical protein
MSNSEETTLEIEFIRTFTNSSFELDFPFWKISLNVFVKDITDSTFKCFRLSI